MNIKRLKGTENREKKSDEKIIKNSICSEWRIILQKDIKKLVRRRV